MRMIKLSVGAIALMSALAPSPVAAEPITVLPEQPSGESCGTVSLVGHTVVGGCHAESRSGGSGVTMHVYAPQKINISTCEVNLEGKIGANGEGYVTSVALTAPHGSPVPCLRTPCDEADGTLRPWPFHIVELGAGDEKVEGTYCIRPISSSPGSGGMLCEVHLPFDPLGGEHQYQLGGSEAFCENIPTVSIEPLIHTMAAMEKVEVVH